MTQAIRSWRQTRRFRAMVRELKALSPRELDALGIRLAEIDHLAREASSIPAAKGPRPDYWTTIRVTSLIIAFGAPIAAVLRLWLGYAA